MVHEAEGVIFGRFHDARLLRTGVHYHIYEAATESQPATTSRPVIVKVPCIPEPSARYARMVRGLAHETLPTFIEDFETEHGTVVVFERIPGATLLALMNEGRYRHDENYSIDLLVQAAHGLEYLHALRPPIVHRDICPKTLLLSDDGRLYFFDLTSATDDPRLAISGADPGVGTFGYVPADQFDQGRVSAASDVYALGATFAHVLTGLSPTDIPKKNLVPDLGALPLSPGLGELLMACMDLDAEARPSATEVAERASALRGPAVSRTSARPASRQAHLSEMSLLEDEDEDEVDLDVIDEPDLQSLIEPTAPPALEDWSSPDPVPDRSSSVPPHSATEVPATPVDPLEEPPLPVVLTEIADDDDDGSKKRITKASKLDDMWNAVVKDPENRAVHEAYVKFAVNSGQYAEAAQRYAPMENAPAPLGAIASEYKRKIGMGAAARIMAAQPKATSPVELGSVAKYSLGVGVGLLTIGALLGNWVFALPGGVIAMFGAWSRYRSRAA